MRIAVAGAGYVGLSIATLLAQNNQVTLVDVIPEKVEKVNKRISPIQDDYIEKYFAEKELNLVATLDGASAYKDADFVVIAAPTNYDPVKNFFDTKYVEQVIELVLSVNKNAMMIIKSTIPVGYTKSIREKYKTNNILFSPEFLRESKALEDNLYPSRIIVGCEPEQKEKAEVFATLLAEGAIKKEVPILFMGLTEAEAVKLFSNTYLALRIAFFNELDTYAEIKGLNTKDIIEGVSLDPRIGDYYNNPSFGYGGYCLRKDTKQLLANYKDIPQNLIEAIVKSNQTRKGHIANMIKKHYPKIVGVYKLAMKKDSDNFRESAIKEIMEKLRDNGIEVIVYETSLKDTSYEGYKVINDIKEFNKLSDIIIANRKDEKLKTLTKPIYTRDIFNKD